MRPRDAFDPMNPVYIAGSGGHARVVLSTLEAAGYTVLGLFDDNPARAGLSVDGIPVLGALADHLPLAAPLVLGIGSNAVRARMARALDGQVEWATVVHPAAWVHRTAQLGEGTVVFAGAVVQPGVVLGQHAIVNTCASVDHDGQVGDFAHVAPGAHLAGAVTLEEGVFFGIGASAVQGLRVGAWTTVGAGAAVVASVPADVVAVGVPARVARTASDRP